MIELTAELNISEDLVATIEDDNESIAELGEITIAGVSSWNGQTGDISYTAPVSSVNGQTGDVVLNIPNAYTKEEVDILLGGYVQPDDLADVAVTGDYDDLINKPSIPTVPTQVSAFDNDAGYLTEHQSLDGYATQSWVGEQGYLTSAPVSSVNGQTGTVTISVPTKTSDLNNDSGFTTQTYVDNLVGDIETLLSAI